MANDSIARGMAGSALGKIKNLPTAFKVKTAVASYSDLPATGNEAGDVRQTLDTGQEYYWDGTVWQEFGANNAVTYLAQTKTTAEKAQARTNIGAGTIYGDGDTTAEPAPVNADTLENHAASYFQTALPAAVNGRYLHANDTTGSLEWKAVDSLAWGNITGSISDQEDLQEALDDKEDTTNKVTSLSPQSTDTQYPSAKCVYDATVGHYVVVNINNQNWGSVSGAGVIPLGSSCTLTATPTGSCTFLCWKDSNGNILSIESTYTFTPTSNMVINAMFNDAGYVKIVSWADGTDAELNAMVQAGYDGIIDITDFWSVGDTRRVSLTAIPYTDSENYTVGENQAAQEVDFTIMDFTCTGFKLASDGTTTPQLIFGAKNYLTSTGYINSTSTNEGGWNGCARRAWCNYGFYNALPSTFKSMVKQFRWQIASRDSSSVWSLVSSDDYFGLTPEKAIFGINCSYSRTDERALYDQWTWYETADNRKKCSGVSGTSPSYWWESSPLSGYSTIFCYVTGSGTADYCRASDSYGIAPFGCL